MGKESQHPLSDAYPASQTSRSPVHTAHNEQTPAHTAQLIVWKQALYTHAHPATPTLIQPHPRLPVDQVSPQRFTITLLSRQIRARFWHRLTSQHSTITNIGAIQIKNIQLGGCREPCRKTSLTQFSFKGPNLAPARTLHPPRFVPSLANASTFATGLLGHKVVNSFNYVWRGNA